MVFWSRYLPTRSLSHFLFAYLLLFALGTIIRQHRFLAKGPIFQWGSVFGFLPDRNLRELWSLVLLLFLLGSGFSRRVSSRPDEVCLLPSLSLTGVCLWEVSCSDDARLSPSLFLTGVRPWVSS